MAALSANKAYVINFGGPRRTYPVAAAKTIYRGGYIGQDPAGYVKPFVPGLMAGFINLEKSTGTGVPEVRVQTLRVAGALA